MNKSCNFYHKLEIQATTSTREAFEKHSANSFVNATASLFLDEVHDDSNTLVFAIVGGIFGILLGKYTPLQMRLSFQGLFFVNVNKYMVLFILNAYGVSRIITHGKQRRLELCQTSVMKLFCFIIFFSKNK